MQRYETEDDAYDAWRQKLVDLNIPTIRFSHLRAFGRSAAHGQHALAVEAEAPHPVTCFELDPKALELGDRLLRLWLERLKNSYESQAFPAYSEAIVPLLIEEELELNWSEE